MKRFLNYLFGGIRAIPEAFIGGLLLLTYHAQNSRYLMRILWRFIYRLRTDNNCRANTFLLLVAIFGLFWLVFFGITPAPPGISAEDIAFSQALGEDVPWFPDLGLKESMKWTGWRFWWYFLGIALVYRLFAWRDEVHRAWERTRQHIAEVREAIKDLTPGQPIPAGTRLENPIGIGAWIKVFAREFLASAFGETVVGGIIRR